MEAIKAVGGWVIGLGIFVAAVLVGMLLIYGATWVSAWAIPYMVWATNIAVLVCLFILLPLSFFRRTRVVAVTGFMISSYIFGICLWMYGLLITMSLWGIGAVFIGLVFIGIGVVFVGMLASIFNAEWLALITLVVGTVFTYGARLIALWLAEKVDRDAYNVRNKIIEANRIAQAKPEPVVRAVTPPPLPKPTTWYYADNGSSIGPFGFADLVNAIATKPDARTIFVWSENMTDWMRASDVPELQQYLR